MSKLDQYFPFLSWARDYQRDHFINDLLAALIVTIMLIPQSLAYSLLAGLPAEVGLYASIFPLLAYALFGTSRTLSVGPVAVASLMTASALAEVAQQGTADYLSAAIVLCEQAGEAREGLEWAQGSVIYYCLHLATELFLKACIQGVGKEPSKHHEIGELWRAYKVLLPGAEYNFQTSWAVSPKELDQIVGVPVLHGVDRTPDQLFRYSMDKKGGASKNIQIFTPGYFFNYMKDLEVRWAGIWGQIKLNAKSG